MTSTWTSDSTCTRHDNQCAFPPELDRCDWCHMLWTAIEARPGYDSHELHLRRHEEHSVPSFLSASARSPSPATAPGTCRTSSRSCPRRSRRSASARPRCMAPTSSASCAVMMTHWTSAAGPGGKFGPKSSANAWCHRDRHSGKPENNTSGGMRGLRCPCAVPRWPHRRQDDIRRVLGRVSGRDRLSASWRYRPG
jgi:hypothetical protein